MSGSLSAEAVEPPQYPGVYERHAYTEPPSRLRELSIYFPRPIEESDPEKTVFVVYIHGGAWRDPLQTHQTCTAPLLARLTSAPSSSPSSPPLSQIAAIASINYHLSPYPSHPTHPSAPDDAERNVRHPAHVRDVHAALRWLGERYELASATSDSDCDSGSGSGEGGKGRVERKGRKWIGVGHSCGATLLLQYIHGLGASGAEPAPSPSSLVLMCGIYDIPLFVENHDSQKVAPEIARVYRDIVEGAFGTDEEVWKAVSPTGLDWSGSAAGEKGKCGLGLLREIVLAYSEEDELVEKEQVEEMERKLKEGGWGGDAKGKVYLKELSGGHDFIWEDGRQVVGLVEETVNRILGL